MSKPLIFGEVLFDQFPSGDATIGGAPFNVASHLHGFAKSPMFVSAIGKDELGQQVLDWSNDAGLDTTSLQQIDKPTGKVAVTLNAGQPSYEILDHQAYDYVDGDRLLDLVSSNDVSLIYHGSLALRHHHNIETMQRLKQQINAPVYVDINLRAPWYDAALIESIITHAAYVKLNDDEFAELMGCDKREIGENLQHFLSKYGNQAVIVTQGADGVFVGVPNGQEYCAADRVDDVVDTVGAGDAFAAVTLVGILSGWAWADTLPRAAEFAASICRQRGATIADASVYSRWLERWESSTSA